MELNVLIYLYICFVLTSLRRINSIQLYLYSAKETQQFSHEQALGIKCEKLFVRKPSTLFLSLFCFTSFFFVVFLCKFKAKSKLLHMFVTKVPFVYCNDINVCLCYTKLHAVL